MASFNKVILMGNLTRDPELRYTPSGAPVCNFDLAMNRSYTTQGGEKRDEVCYMTVVVWGKQGEACGQFLEKGRQVYVEGELRHRSFENKEGKEQHVTEIVAQKVRFLGGSNNGKAKEEQPPQVDPDGDDIPF